MIRRCTDDDFEAVHTIINDAAEAYRGVIQKDRWKVPYMPRDALRDEIDDGVVFWGYGEEGTLTGVMGIQTVRDVTLIRHAYVRTASRNRGIGHQLLDHLLTLTEHPLLVGTWAAADWAIRFYEKTWLQRRESGTKEPALEGVLVYSRTPSRDVSGTRRRQVVRAQQMRAPIVDGPLAVQRPLGPDHGFCNGPIDSPPTTLLTVFDCAEVVAASRAFTINQVNVVERLQSIKARTSDG